MPHEEVHPLAGHKVLLNCPALDPLHGRWFTVVDWYSRIVGTDKWLKDKICEDRHSNAILIQKPWWGKYYPNMVDFIQGEFGESGRLILVHASFIGGLASEWVENHNPEYDELAVGKFFARDDGYSVRLLKGGLKPSDEFFWDQFWTIYDPNGNYLYRMKEWYQSNPRAPLQEIDRFLFLYELKHKKKAMAATEKGEKKAPQGKQWSNKPKTPPAPPRRVPPVPSRKIVKSTPSKPEQTNQGSLF